MTTPPSRRRFQIHLSTAVVLMFAAGGLIWAMTRERAATSGRVVERRNGAITERVLTVEEFEKDADAVSWYGSVDQYHGFPFDVFESKSNAVVSKKPALDYNVIDGPTKQWRGGAMIYNFFVAIMILFGVWFLSEWVIRRRDARKEA